MPLSAIAGPDRHMTFVRQVGRFHDVIAKIEILPGFRTFIGACEPKGTTIETVLKAISDWNCAQDVASVIEYKAKFRMTDG